MNQTQIKTEGVVFTPPIIAQSMVKFMANTHNQRILEPSCGEGSIIEHIPIHNKIIGLDINSKFLKKCKQNYPHIQVIKKNFLDFKVNQNNLFDCIIGNPPYVKIQNMNPQDVEKMRQEYPEYIQGNTNLYIYFLLKSLDLLKDTGRLIFLIPNTLFYNKSLLPVWQKILLAHQVQHVIDFRDTQIFEGVSTYTCILYLTKTANTMPYFLYRNSLNGNDIKKFFKKQIKKDKNSMFRARIGLMTLCDDVFIIREWVYSRDNKYITFHNSDKLYTIEAAACKDILKVSKNEIHKIIYPYDIDKNGKIDINLHFMKLYPKAYQYLEAHRHLLNKRDSGKVSDYPAWYAYGRTQSLLCNTDKRIFLSSVVNGQITLDKQTLELNVPLYYSGLWLEPQRENIKNNDIKQWLYKYQNDIFQRSNLRSGGWYAISQGSFDL